MLAHRKERPTLNRRPENRLLPKFLLTASIANHLEGCNSQITVLLFAGCLLNPSLFLFFILFCFCFAGSGAGTPADRRSRASASLHLLPPSPMRRPVQRTVPRTRTGEACPRAVAAKADRAQAA